MEILLIVILLGMTGLAVWLGIQLVQLRARFKPIVDQDEELRKGAKDLERKRNELLELDKKYGSARSVYERLKSELSLLEENLEDISFGLYKPHFNFDAPAKVKAAIQRT